MAIRFAALLVAPHGLIASLAAEAKQAGKVQRIRVLGNTHPTPGGTPLDAFRQGLRELVRADQVIE